VAGRTLTFSNVTVPIKKSSPSTRKRDSLIISSPKGNKIALKLAHKRQEKLDNLAN